MSRDGEKKSQRSPKSFALVHPGERFQCASIRGSDGTEQVLRNETKRQLSVDTENYCFNRSSDTWMAHYKLNEKFLIFEGKLQKMSLWLISELVRCALISGLLKGILFWRGLSSICQRACFIPL